MYVSHLSLADFRSYPSAEVALDAGVTTFVGANGQGKTNLVEAVEFLSTLSSHRVAADLPLVRAGCEQATVRARVQASPEDDRTLLLEVDILARGSNRARINRSPLRRARELIGTLRTVVFSPEDLAIVKGEPAQRRDWVDSVVVSRWPRLAGVKADYDRVLRQRTTLLKSLSGRGRTVAVPGSEAASTLDVWNDHLARLGAELMSARLQTVADLADPVAAAYRSIAPTNNLASASYRSAIEVADGPSREDLVERLLTQMEQRRGDELQRGVSLVGPHRDDLDLLLGELPVKGYASHGESWSMALGLRLASVGLLLSEDVVPVLVLDDVFAELDATRRARLADLIGGVHQVLVTAAVAEDIPATLSGQRYQVQAGEVSHAG